ncbi:hypothetical protein Sjap_023686 [Stephania japonica]|uniref:Uncharacterized protein n=1 Tax=Stephania japonica TaxID=461633 RepID=A0AAP0HKQ9_9MAGN
MRRGGCVGYKKKKNEMNEHRLIISFDISHSLPRHHHHFPSPSSTSAIISL